MNDCSFSNFYGIIWVGFLTQVLRRKCPNTEFFLVHISLYSDKKKLSIWTLHAMRKTRYLRRFDFGANRKNIAGFPLCQELSGIWEILPKCQENCWVFNVRNFLCVKWRYSIVYVFPVQFQKKIIRISQCRIGVAY